jgi:hypothetical protein
MAELTGDPRCNFCRHLSSSHRAEFAADASVPCVACPGGRCPPEAARVKDGRQEANPHRAGACPECGAYRSDGRPPYLHDAGCSRESDLQFDRWLEENQAGDHGGPVLYCTEHDHPAGE